MLRGHAIGGSRRLNGHWQSGKESYRWVWRGKRETYGQDTTPRNVVVFSSGIIFLKNAPIPAGLVSVLSQQTTDYTSCTWAKVKVEADYITDFIAYKSSMTQEPSEVYGRQVITPHPLSYYTGETINLSTPNSDDWMDFGAGYIDIMPISKKESTVVYDSVNDFYHLGGTLVFYVPLNQYYHSNGSQVLDYAFLNHINEIQGGNTPQDEDYNIKISVKLTNWTTVYKDGYWV